MIRNRQALSMAEVQEYLGKEEKNKDLSVFIKKLVKLNAKEAKEMRKKLESLEIMRLKEEDIVKIIDVMPENEAELNKIFNGAGLEENETNKILDTVKQFK